MDVDFGAIRRTNFQRRFALHSIQKFGTKTAGIISAICFGIYHWFSMGVLGNPVQMIFIFCMMGIWGFMFAMAFAKTKSLYLPVGLHFGWNLVSSVVFSQGPLANQLLLSSGGQKLGGVLAFVVFLFQVFAIPLVAYWYLRRHSLKKQFIDKEQPPANVLPIGPPDE